MCAMQRRDWLKSVAVGGLAATGFGVPRLARADDATTPTPVDIGDRLELFVDQGLIERLSGEASRRLHHPTPAEVVLQHDQPWEGSGSGYHSVFQDGDRYRMYYKAWDLQASQGRVATNRHPLYCCHA
ncbi:MAG: hypothetical protein KDA55_20920, partial [Planctomycetales bacterium]|nr:hypothetical protein [Planctomycetales bacterium]